MGKKRKELERENSQLAKDLKESKDKVSNSIPYAINIEYLNFFLPK